MSILFGHPGGTPFSHNAALAYFEAHRLEAFCVPWMPSLLTLQALERVGPLRSMAQRLARRRFPGLTSAPKIQGRPGEFRRLLTRVFTRTDESISYQANDWLMRTMARECRRPSVTAVHSYEDCSLEQFAAAKRLGKACIYDMPIGYYPAWEQTQAELASKYRNWLPAAGLPANRFVRPRQKRQEMALADLVMVPSAFVAATVRSFHPDKPVALAPYGVDLSFWQPGDRKERPDLLRFTYAGQMSLRKGIPLLLDAWEKADLRSAELQLVGSWYLSERKRQLLPRNVTHLPACSAAALRNHYRRSDVFVFPSFFEGFGLVLLEAMACGLPAIASTATAGPDVLAGDSGRILPTGDLDGLVEALRWFDQHRDLIPEMGRAARKRAEQCTWERYRDSLAAATAAFV